MLEGQLHASCRIGVINISVIQKGGIPFFSFPFFSLILHLWVLHLWNKLIYKCFHIFHIYTRCNKDTKIYWKIRDCLEIICINCVQLTLNDPDLICTLISRTLLNIVLQEMKFWYELTCSCFVPKDIAVGISSCLTTHLLISDFLNHSLIQFLRQPRLL